MTTPSPSSPSPPPPATTAAASETEAGTEAGAAPPFEFPREYWFPPFFTRQTNLTTHHSQLDKWGALVLGYCAHRRLYRLALSSPAADALFHNRRLGRRLAAADAREVLDHLRKEGRAEFLPTTSGNTNHDGLSDEAWIYWKTPDEWAREVEAWVDDTAQKGTVLTLYELTEGEDTRGARTSHSPKLSLAFLLYYCHISLPSELVL